MTYADHPLGQYGGINPELYKRRQREEKDKRDFERLNKLFAKPKTKPSSPDKQITSVPSASKLDNKSVSPEVDFKGKKPTIKQIALSICKRYNHDYNSLTGAKKNVAVMKFRTELYVESYLRRPDKSLVEIGREIGGRDHSTLINILKKLGVYGATRIYKDVNKRQLIQKRKEGLTLSECAKHFNSDVYSIWCQLNENSDDDKNEGFLLLSYQIEHPKGNVIDKGTTCLDTIHDLILNAADNGHKFSFWPHEGE